MEIKLKKDITPEEMATGEWVPANRAHRRLAERKKRQDFKKAQRRARHAKKIRKENEAQTSSAICASKMAACSDSQEECQEAEDITEQIP